jgi:hypothetical protein
MFQESLMISVATIESVQYEEVFLKLQKNWISDWSSFYWYK